MVRKKIKSKKFEIVEGKSDLKYYDKKFRTKSSAEKFSKILQKNGFKVDKLIRFSNKTNKKSHFMIFLK